MRTTLLSGIFSHILNNPDNEFVLALGGVQNDVIDLRYWPWGAEQDSDYPYAVSYIVSETNMKYINADVCHFEWQMMIFTNTITEGDNLASLCKRLFDNKILCYGTYFFNCIHNATFSAMRGEDADPFQTTVTFNCYMEM